MFNLALDSSGEETLLATEVEKKGEKKVINARTPKAENLAGLLDKHLRSLNLSIAELKEIFVGIGPGGFTGLRVSLAYAKALAYGQGAIIRPFSLLDLIRQAYIREKNLEKQTPVCCFLDGRQKFVFVSTNEKEVSYVGLTHLENWLEQLRNKHPNPHFLLYGSFAKETHKVLENCLGKIGQNELLAWEKIANLAPVFDLPKLGAYKGTTIFNLTPNYLRAPVT